MFEVLSIVLAIAFSLSNAPPQTVSGETQGPNVTSTNAADPPENQGGGGIVADPPENQGGGGG